MKINPYFSSREFALILILGSVFCVILGKGFYLAGPGREDCLKRTQSVATENGELPAPRGKILDSNGQVLAWSEKYYDLYFLPQIGISLDEESEQLLSSVLPRTRGLLPLLHGGEETAIIVAKAVSAEELSALKELIQSCTALALKPRVERIRVSNPILRRKIGEVREERGMLYGKSGFELQFDETLRGTPGRYTVICDRFRHWIPKSWQLLAEPVPGRDVHLSEPIRKLLREDQP